MLDENLLIISEEFHKWEDSKRRIDLLALDEDGNLVVIELKRTEDGGHMELQSLRYAAMISAMTFDDVVQTYQEYLADHEPEAKDQAESRIHQFLDTTDDESVIISNVPRIILISADFSLEITTTVLWLVDRGIDIRCIQMIPYKVGDKVLVDLRQVIPLTQAVEYQVRLRQKQEVARQTNGGRRELTLKILMRNGVIKPGTEIEVMPEALPISENGKSSNTYRALIVDPSRRESVKWLLDDNSYSISQLTVKLAEEHNMKWLANNITLHWRIIGQEDSLWDLARKFDS